MNKSGLITMSIIGQVTLFYNHILFKNRQVFPNLSHWGLTVFTLFSGLDAVWFIRRERVISN